MDTLLQKRGEDTGVKHLLMICLTAVLGGCSLVTAPVKVAAAAVETTVDTASTVVRVTGKVIDLAADTKEVAEKAEDVARN